MNQKGFTSLVLILIALLGLATAAGGLVLFQKLNSKAPETFIHPPRLTPSPSPTVQDATIYFEPTTCPQRLFMKDGVLMAYTETAPKQVQTLPVRGQDTAWFDEFCHDSFDKVVPQKTVSPSTSVSKITHSPTPTPSAAGMAGCNGNEYFSVSPLKPEDIATILPLGNFNPPGHTFPTRHLYLHIRESGADTPAKVPLFAPGDITLTQIRSSEHNNSSDYSLYFSHCSQIKAYFGHVSDITQKLKDAFKEPFEKCDSYSTGGSSYKSCDKNISLTFKAGEEIGTTGGNSKQRALDFGLVDYRTSLTFANQNRWKIDEYQNHMVCALDYFNAGTADPLRSKLGYYKSKRTTAPVCGEVNQDVPGTASGVWFKKGTTNTYPEDPHLTLAKDNVNPSLGVFSIGNSLNLSSGIYYFNPAGSGQTNREFKGVTTDNNLYCYEPNDNSGNRLLGTIILVQLTSQTNLKIEKQSSNSCGSGPWSFGSSVVEFER